jgi:hypothetical protein
MKLAEHIAGMLEIRNTYKILIGKPETIPLGRHRPKWKDDDKIGLK